MTSPSPPSSLQPILGHLKVLCRTEGPQHRACRGHCSWGRVGMPARGGLSKEGLTLPQAALWLVQRWFGAHTWALQSAHRQFAPQGPPGAFAGFCYLHLPPPSLLLTAGSSTQAAHSSVHCHGQMSLPDTSNQTSCAAHPDPRHNDPLHAATPHTNPSLFLLCLTWRSTPCRDRVGISQRRPLGICCSFPAVSGDAVKHSQIPLKTLGMAMEIICRLPTEAE